MEENEQFKELYFLQKRYIKLLYERDKDKPPFIYNMLLSDIDKAKELMELGEKIRNLEKLL